MELCNPSVISDILSRHGFSFSKGLGQNFIINPDICPRMAKECGAGAADGILEIGPGIGVLTKELAHVAKCVVAVELDDRLFPILGETLRGIDNVLVVKGDAMKLDLNELIKKEFADCESVCVCANLPYYITSPLIMRLLEEKLPLKSVTVMVQKEAADRLCASVGSRESGAVTVAVAYHADTVRLFNVPRSAFMPSPKVDSAVIRLNLRPSPDVADEALFFRAVKAGFGQRRKTLTNSLSSGGFDKASVAAALNAVGLPQTIRAEALTMQSWQELARELANR